MSFDINKALEMLRDDEHYYGDYIFTINIKINL